MITRELAVPEQSFFLVGPRQTGKTQWLTSLNLQESWLVNLLLNDTYFRYLRDPAQFRREAEEKIRAGAQWIVIDEVQRIPELLNEVHQLMESSSVRFILSGSSARKLRRSGANLLGGRAILRNMHPFTVFELGQKFDLEHALRFGTLPAIFGLSESQATEVLHAYVELYVREEIQMEGLVRNLGGFTRFLDLAGAYSGDILNFSSLAKESRLPIKTVQSYFEVLEDTLIGIRLPAWTRSPLKRLVAHPKYYLFDNGLTNALTRRLASPPDAALRGRLFEQFMVQETRRRLDHARSDCRIYFWRTNNGAEVDLVIEKQGEPALAVEFRSRPQISGADLSGLRSIRDDYPQLPCCVVCTAPEPFSLDFASILPWRDYLAKLSTVLQPLNS